MASFIRFVAQHLLFWVLYFALWKLVLLLYHASGGFLQVVWNGLILDVSFAAYLSILPAFIFAVCWLLRVSPKYVLATWFGLCALITSSLAAADLEVLRIWGNRIDASILPYLATPAEATASVQSSPLLLLFSMAIASIALCAFAYKYWLGKIKWMPPAFSMPKLAQFVAMLALTAALIVPMRGGLQQIPINQSHVAHTANHFMNQAAVNPCWNFFHSLGKELHIKENPYQKFASVEEYGFGKTDTCAAPALLRTQRPNVILLIWESFTSKVVERQGGVAGITPNFDKLCKEGIFFSNIYAAGSRTDKGIVAILSGYPSLPLFSIIKTPQKVSKLPKLPADMASLGYSTSFFYGGEAEFANMKSYLYQSGYQNFIEKKNFGTQDQNSKWGAHDHVLLERFLQETPPADSAFFKTILTLSSHEPFDVPYPVGYQENLAFDRRDNQFMHAHRYTDHAVGQFIAQAKKMPWWENTLLIIVGDHGSVSPFMGHEVAVGPQNYKIPMLWLGGALATKDTCISQLAGQASLPGTLLRILGQNAAHYKWEPPFFCKPNAVFYTFNNGVAAISDAEKVLYDYNTGKTVYQEGQATPDLLRKGQAYLQWSCQDYLDK